jgi:ketosteroid isomerase-like protein
MVTTIGERNGYKMSQLTAAEIDEVRRIIDIHAIQEVMLRYVRAVDRNDAKLMATIYWDDGYDDHGMYKGSAKGFFEQSVKNRNLLTCRAHNLGPPRVEFVGEGQAKVETYFFFFGVFVGDDGEETYAASGGRYRDLFEKRADEWKVLRRVVVYDWSLSGTYEPGWDFLKIPPGINRGAIEPHDATYAPDW